MKKTMIVVLMVLFAAGASAADQWCQWDETSGINCQSDSRGYIVINGFKVSTPAIANAKGYYKVVVTEPTVGADQTRDAEVWAFSDNTITKTWTVRDLTATELDQREAGAMPISEYYIWKALLVKGVITQQEAATYLPAELIDAYLARKRLLGD